KNKYVCTKCLIKELDSGAQQAEVTQQAEVHNRLKQRSKSMQKTTEFQEAFSVQVSASDPFVCNSQPITAEGRNICNLKCVVNSKRQSAVHVKSSKFLS
ncbi:hypothetical protein AVEN_87298-1, partial [Araneus ventricosus]